MISNYFFIFKMISIIRTNLHLFSNNIQISKTYKTSAKKIHCLHPDEPISTRNTLNIKTNNNKTPNKFESIFTKIYFILFFSYIQCIVCSVFCIQWYLIFQLSEPKYREQLYWYLYHQPYLIPDHITKTLNAYQ